MSIISNKILRVFLVAVFAISLGSNAFAQDGEKATGFHADFLKAFDGAADKVTSLAEAIPEEKFDWRPAEGVRSVKESLMHIAGADFFLAMSLGKDLPEGINPRELEKTIETKEAAMEMLKKSIAHVRSAIEAVPAEDLNNEIDLFNGKASLRRVIMIVGDHMNEHLGQLIAYARSNDVVPPWSQSNN